MKLKELNNTRFLEEAFDERHNRRLAKAARFRRNIYLALFFAGFACILATAFTDRMELSILALFLATLSLVVVTKYDTQLFFLRIIKLRGNQGAGQGEEA